MTCPACGLPVDQLPGRCPDCGGVRLVHADVEPGTFDDDRLWDCHAQRCGQGHLIPEKVPA